MFMRDSAKDMAKIRLFFFFIFDPFSSSIKAGDSARGVKDERERDRESLLSSLSSVFGK